MSRWGTRLSGPTLVAVIVCAVALAAGFALKGRCLAPWDGRQYRELCYNDIQPLYEAREVGARVFPYVHGRLDGDELVAGAIEYPVLTGVFMWAGGAPVSNPDDYLRLSAVLLAPFGLAVSYLLARMAGWRALLWSAAPALALYAFHNWDLLAVAATTAGLWSWRRGRTQAAGMWFGIGGALKLYPLMFAAPLLLEGWSRNRRRALQSAGVCAATWALVNLPFVVLNPPGWSATYEFHALRGADFNSIWAWGWPSLGPDALNLLTSTLTVLLLAGALGYGWWVSGRGRDYPWLQVCGAMLAGFLLVSKVHSPQYALWLLPLFVLVRVPTLLWAAYSAVDLVLYVGIFRWFYDTTYRGLDFTFAKRALIFGVWARAALLTALIVVFLRSRPATPVDEGAPALVVGTPRT